MGNTYKLLLTTFLKLKELVTNFLSAVGKVGYSAMVGGNCENLWLQSEFPFPVAQLLDFFILSL